MRNSERDLEARRRAQALWDESKTQNQKVLDEREKERLAAVSKIARLRELRLAKEAADRKAAEQRYLKHHSKSRG